MITHAQGLLLEFSYLPFEFSSLLFKNFKTEKDPYTNSHLLVQMGSSYIKLNSFLTETLWSSNLYRKVFCSISQRLMLKFKYLSRLRNWVCANAMFQSSKNQKGLERHTEGRGRGGRGSQDFDSISFLCTSSAKFPVLRVNSELWHWTLEYFL